MFPVLTQLFQNDREKVRRLLGLFERVTRDDIRRMDIAFAEGNRAEIRSLSHKMKSAYLQIGEETAAGCLGLLESLADGQEQESLETLFRTTRSELERVMERVRRYLDFDP